MVYLMLSNNVKLGINLENKLFVKSTDKHGGTNIVIIGSATVDTFNRIKDGLDRLTIHAVED